MNRPIDTPRLPDNTIIGHGCVIDSAAIIGDNCQIGHNTIIGAGVVIGQNIVIESQCIIGYGNLTKIYDDRRMNRPTIIGDNSLIRTGSVVYAGCQIGHQCHIGHNVVLREETKIGSGTSIGCLVKCEGYTTIGINCSIHAQTHLTSFMTIEDFVFIGPGVITTNDPRIDYRRGIGNAIAGPTIRRACRIGGGVTICPGVEIGENAFIAAGSLVTKNVAAKAKVMTGAAKTIGQVDDAELLP